MHANPTEGTMMFSRVLTNVGAGIALAAALALGSGAAAYAHECYNPSRSDQGDAKAGANSKAWFTLVVADAIQGDADSGFITQDETAGGCLIGHHDGGLTLFIGPSLQFFKQSRSSSSVVDKSKTLTFFSIHCNPRH